MNNDRFLIILAGSKDIDIVLAPVSAGVWINSDYDGSYTETVPQNVLDDLPNGADSTVEVASRSFQNDRALLIAGAMGCDGSFDSVVEMTRYIKDNNINIVDEFHGVIY